MKLKLLVGILVILIAVNLATIGSYLYRMNKHGDHFRHKAPLPWLSHPERPGGMPSDRPGHALRGKLNRAERERLMQLLSELRMETEDLRILIHDMESEVMMALRQDTIPRDRVDSLLHEISTVHLQISQKATNKMIEAKSHLSTEQQELFYDAMLRARAYGPGNAGMKGMFRKGHKRPGQRGSRHGREVNKDRSKE
jgi:hypothetical protein